MYRLFRAILLPRPCPDLLSCRSPFPSVRRAVTLKFRVIRHIAYEVAVAEGERSLAIFIDFENLALGFQGRRERFDIARVLERMVEKGKIVAKKAYADWSRFSHFTHALHESAIELIEIPRRAQSGKNSADIRLCVDAMDLAYSKEHINTFVI